MKYIKTYEKSTKCPSLGEKELIPGNMYLFNNMHVGYIGHNGSSYPLLFFLFENGYRGNFQFIDWTENLRVLNLKSMNITIKDYIIQNNIVSKTLKDVEKKEFASGPAGNDKELIKKFKEDLLSDDRIKIQN